MIIVNTGKLILSLSHLSFPFQRNRIGAIRKTWIEIIIRIRHVLVFNLHDAGELNYSLTRVSLRRVWARLQSSSVINDDAVTGTAPLDRNISIKHKHLSDQFFGKTNEYFIEKFKNIYFKQIFTKGSLQKKWILWDTVSITEARNQAWGRVKQIETRQCLIMCNFSGGFPKCVVHRT